LKFSGFGEKMLRCKRIHCKSPEAKKVINSEDSFIRKSKAILKARTEGFDGDFLFPQNEKDGADHVKILDFHHRRAIEKTRFWFPAL